VPRHWFAGSAVATHIANGANLLFPAGERFFVRSVRHFIKVIEGDALLMEQVRGFAGQEGRHANAHEKQFAVLEAQGYALGPFARVYETFAYGFLERILPPEVRLSATVAAEHFTAIMAENAFRERTLDAAHSVMRDFLLWHAAEEIEHRAVAFEVLQRVNPSYALRMAGLAISTVMLAGFWAAGTLVLLAQDGVGVEQARRELGEMKAARHATSERSLLDGVFGRGIREYVRRDFHPMQNAMDGYAVDFFAKMAKAS
jgi:predicted metal-dependent hydrolase